jgi:hypothetical protein
MNAITKNIRTHIVILSDWRELQITYEQYQSLKIKLDDSKYNDPLTIRDCDTNKILFDWKVWAIKEFKHKEQNKSNELRTYCWYWNTHIAFTKCDCDKEYGYSEWQLQKYILNTYGWYYPSRIDSKLRKEFWHINHAKNWLIINHE